LGAKTRMRTGRGLTIYEVSILNTLEVHFTRSMEGRSSDLGKGNATQGINIDREY